MQPIGRATRVLITVLLISTSGCLLPLAAWTADGYTVDVSRSAEGSSVVGHCFRLLDDIDIVRSSISRQIALKNGEKIDVYGKTEFGSSWPTKVTKSKGSKIIVERVLSWRNVETSSLKAYIRIDDQLVDATNLFRNTGKGEGTFRLTYIDRLLETCEGNSQ